MIRRTVETWDLNSAFFPVEEQPINWGGFMGKYTHIPGYKAIVDSTTGNTLCVVSSKYRLVTNQEAYGLADYVVKAIFEDKSLQDFECFNILMPKTKGSCRIDLIIPNNFSKLFGNINESWTPFVRIANSYNRTSLLRFEIGFCRWICLNGVIFGQTGITFAISHSGSITIKEIDRLIEKAKKQIGDIRSLWKSFEIKMEKLRNIPLPSSAALAIFCKVFNIRVNKDEVTEAQKENLSLRAQQIVKASKEYFKELGNNAYAMMNVMTDYASFPEWTNNRANYVDGYQKRVGIWVDDFIGESEKKGFSLSRYIGDDYQNTAYYLESLVPEI